MYWVIHYRNGVAITEANDYQSAEDWCLLHLGHSRAPFAITPAKDEDLAEGSDSEVYIDEPGFDRIIAELDDQAFTSFLVSNDKHATRH